MPKGPKGTKVGGWLGLFLAAWLLPLSAQAQEAADLEVALVTVGPGEVYWSRFGHNAILIENAETGEGRLYNFGMFDFEQENFLLNFVRGRMTYMLAVSRPEADYHWYRAENRWTRIQKLALSPLQKSTIASYLHWHAQPANADYLYDYYRNNCSTKVRDSLDRALGGQLRELFSTMPAARGNYRDHTNRLTAPELWLYLGTQIGLGRMVDAPISRWEEFFVPMQMMEALRGATIRWEDGSEHPLVREEYELPMPSAHQAPAAAPVWWPWFLLAGMLLAAAMAAIDRRGRPWLSIIWWSLSGLAGLGLLGLWLFTDHQSAYRNENLLLLSPLGLLLAPALLANWPRLARVGALTLLASLAAALLLKLILDPVQNNWEILAFAIPVQAVAAGLVLWRSDRDLPLSQISKGGRQGESEARGPRP